MKRVLLIGLMLALAGCDYFPGPRIASRLDGDAHVAVQYSDGTASSFTLKPCLRYIVGRASSSVTKISITQERAQLANLDDAGLRRLAAEQDVEDVTLVDIYVSAAGPASADPDPNKCPSPH